MALNNSNNSSNVIVNVQTNYQTNGTAQATQANNQLTQSLNNSTQTYANLRAQILQFRAAQQTALQQYRKTVNRISTSNSKCCSG